MEMVQQRLDKVENIKKKLGLNYVEERKMRGLWRTKNVRVRLEITYTGS